MRRARRRILGRVLGLTAAVAVHLLAVLAVLPVVRQGLQDRSHPDASAPLTIVQLIHLEPRVAAAAPQPEDAPQSKPASLPEEAAPFETALADPETPGPSPSGRPEDNDPLYRVPFRDAVAQADARLRAGLGCAHVDLQQLPRTVFDLCAAASKIRDAPEPRGPTGAPLG